MRTIIFSVDEGFMLNTMSVIARCCFNPSLLSILNPYEHLCCSIVFWMVACLVCTTSKMPHHQPPPLRHHPSVINQDSQPSGRIALCWQVSIPPASSVMYSPESQCIFRVVPIIFLLFIQFSKTLVFEVNS